MEIKTKANKWYPIKLKSFCTAKETVNPVKRQPSKWKKIIANETTDRGLISKIYKQLIQINARRKKQHNQKVGKRPKQTFLQRRLQMTNKHMKRCSIFIIIAAAAAAAKSLQSCPTLCDPIDGCPPGSSVPGILQARTLEWVAISFSNT